MTTSTLQRSTPVVGWVDGVAVSRCVLEDRLRSLYRCDRSCVLPVQSTPEGRQLIRWVAHVLLVETLCRVEAERRGLSPVGSVQSDPRDDCEFGSIIAAAFRESGFVRAVFYDVTSGVDVDEDVVVAAVRLTIGEESEARYVLRHQLLPSRSLALQAARQPERLPLMGVATYSELPRVLAENLGTTVGTVIGPLRSPMGWHVASVDEVIPPGVPEVSVPSVRERLLTCARRHRFIQWVGLEFAERVTTVPGFEHPADPRQPDNHHRH